MKYRNPNKEDGNKPIKPSAPFLISSIKEQSAKRRLSPQMKGKLIRRALREEG